MKNLFLTSIVLFLVFIFGCQESSITDPTQPLAKAEIGAVNHNIIAFKYELTDPSSGTAYDLSGEVKFNNTVISSFSADGQVWVKVRLEMVAQLFNSRRSDHPMWKIEKKTEDRVLLSNTDPQTKTLQKAYFITNRDDVKLIVTYLITSKTVKVAAVFLKAFNAAEDDDA